MPLKLDFPSTATDDANNFEVPSISTGPKASFPEVLIAATSSLLLSALLDALISPRD